MPGEVEHVVRKAQEHLAASTAGATPKPGFIAICSGVVLLMCFVAIGLSVFVWAVKSIVHSLADLLRLVGVL